MNSTISPLLCGNGIDRMLLHAAEQKMQNGIEKEYRRCHRRAGTRRYLTAVAVAAVAVTLIGRFVMPVVEYISSQPDVTAGDVCNVVTQILVQS